MMETSSSPRLGIATSLDSFTWRLARLHPAWVTLIVWIGYLLLALVQTIADLSVVADLVTFGGFMLLYLGYPVFVVFFVSGRFRSRSVRRPMRALAAFVVIGLVSLVVSSLGEERMEALGAAANSGDLVSSLTFSALFLSLMSAFLYLTISAAFALVDAERGSVARRFRKVATAFQFLYLPLCVFFLHRRIRRLIRHLESNCSMRIPLEKLSIEHQASGHLSLLFTESVGWDEFEPYAKELLYRLDGKLLKKTETVDMHLWDVEIETAQLLLVFDDHPLGVTLESRSYPGDMLLKRLQAKLMSAA